MTKIKVAVAALFMTCALSTEVSAQNDLGGILGKLIEQASDKSNANSTQKQQDSKVNKGSILEGLSNIFSDLKVASADDLVGTWQYSGPAIIFESDDLMLGAGGKMAAQRMEGRIKEITEKYGLTKDLMTITFDKDGNFNQKYRKINLSGTYTVDKKQVILKYSGKYDQLAGETQIEGKNLCIVMDLERLNNYIVSITSASPDPKVQFVSSLLSKMKGVSCGMRFEKVN